MTNSLKLHILTPQIKTQNVIGFLSPIITNMDILKDIGISFKLYNNLNETITECDYLLINAKFFGRDWTLRPNYVIETLDKLNKKKLKIFYCDNYDSTSPIKTQVLPYIDIYLKNMVLKNKNLYKNKFYGGRIHTDYYFNNFQITDTDEFYSTPILKNEYIDKIKVSWNYGLANYGFLGRRIANLYTKFPIKLLLDWPQLFKSPSEARDNDVFCRISTNYSRETIAFHRKLLKKKLENKYQLDRVSIYKYIKEIKNSKIVVSPFGWGEFSLRDFETFIEGGILFKPNMEHLETYPNFYIKNETYIPFNWDFSDLIEKLEETIENYSERIKIAELAQSKYFYYLKSVEAKQEFCMRFYNILNS